MDSQDRWTGVAALTFSTTNLMMYINERINISDLDSYTVVLIVGYSRVGFIG